MEWYDFYCGYSEWADSTLRTRISSLEDIGSGDEVVEVIIDLPTEKLQVQLVRKAMRCGVSFTQENIDDLWGELPDEVCEELAEYSGLRENDAYDLGFLTMSDAEFKENLASFEANINVLCNNLDIIFPTKPKKKKKPGFFGTLFSLIGAFAGSGSEKKNDTGYCDGDCANCPPHYGYRYGRWYYGHHHVRECERGGNGGG